MTNIDTAVSTTTTIVADGMRVRVRVCERMCVHVDVAIEKVVSRRDKLRLRDQGVDIRTQLQQCVDAPGVGDLREFQNPHLHMPARQTNTDMRASNVIMIGVIAIVIRDIL